MFLSSTAIATAQETRAEDEVARLLTATLGELDQPRSRVVLLGTFHFQDAGLDAYKPEHTVEVLSETRQREIADLVERLAAYAPTRIGVEFPAARQGELDSRYRAYREGNYQLTANERDQLGLRLAAQLDHERIYAIDADGAWLQPRIDADGYAAEHGQQRYLEDPYEAAFLKAAQLLDELKTRQTLRETLLVRNDPRLIVAGHGVYLSRIMAVGDGETYPGVDGFRTHWYNRNLRIFANIQRLTEDAPERILIIIGAGHLPILRHAVVASPEYELVEVKEVLR